MDDDPRLLDLLVRYQDLKQQGQWPTPEDICADCPELLPAFRRKLAALHWVEQHFGTGSAKPTDLSTQAPADPSPESALGLEVLTLAGRYECLSLHAAGGMGEVWKARDATLGRPVVLKVLKSRYLGNDGAAQRFVTEALVTSRLDHPGIAAVHGMGRLPDGRPWYAMRFIDGQSLRAVIQEFHQGSSNDQRSDPAGRPQPVPDAKRPPEVSFDSLAFRELLQRFIAACETIAFAHSLGIIHRDIKPDNIMVGHYGETLVIDWGLAKVLTSDPNVDPGDLWSSSSEYHAADVAPALGQILGTPSFMSPEQAEGRTEKIGPATDIYSLGATLYFLLTGHAPFRESHPDRLLLQVRRGDFPAPRSAGGVGVPAALQAICLKAMAREPEQRYASALDLAQDLKRWLADEPVRAYPEPFSTRFRRLLRRHRQAAVAAAVALVLIALVSVVAMVVVENQRQATAAALRAESLAKQEEAAARSTAEQARNHALDALRSLTDDLVLHRLSQTPGSAAENQEFLRAVLVHFERFAAIQTDDVASRLIRAEGLGRLAYLRYYLGELKEARSACAEAQAILRQLHQEPLSSQPDHVRHLAVNCNLMALILKASGETREAEALFGEAKTHYTRALTDDPDRPEFLSGLAMCCTNLGNLLSDTARLPAAEKEYAQAIAIYKRLADAHPDRPRYREELAISHNNLGLLQHDLKRLEDAQTSFGRALAIFKQLTLAHPHRPDFRQNLGMCHNNLANLFVHMGSLSKAEAAFAEALAVYQRLAADFPARPQFRQELAMAHSNRAALLQMLKKREEARHHSAEALAIYRRLAADFPTHANLRSELANALNNLAVGSNEEQQFSAALKYLAEAEPHHQAALKASPEHVQYRQFYRNALWATIKAYAGMLNHKEASQSAQKLCDLGWDPAQNAYDAAVGLTRCIAVLDKLDHISEDERASASTFYADRAMSMLKTAVTRGFASPERLRTDMDLLPLRERADFSQLVNDLENRKR